VLSNPRRQLEVENIRLHSPQPRSGAGSRYRRWRSLRIIFCRARSVFKLQVIPRFRQQSNLRRSGRDKDSDDDSCPRISSLTITGSLSRNDLQLKRSSRARMATHVRNGVLRLRRILTPTFRWPTCDLCLARSAMARNGVHIVTGSVSIFNKESSVYSLGDLRVDY
jgi:hypothetical protein